MVNVAKELSELSHDELQYVIDSYLFTLDLQNYEAERNQYQILESLEGSQFHIL